MEMPVNKLQALKMFCEEQICEDFGIEREKLGTPEVVKVTQEAS